MCADRDFDIRNFGAVADGKTDCTVAIQNALDAAGQVQGTVYVPHGEFACSGLKMHPRTGLRGDPAWTFKLYGGSALKLIDPDARCMVDITDAIGATVHGLCLNGSNLGKHIHGVMLSRPEFPSVQEPTAQEDTPRIERCKIGHFSGNGIHLEWVWCFSIRHCMSFANGGDGIWLKGCDGFVLDNWLSCNARAGFAAREHNAAVTMMGNRIEWNRQAGILSLGGSNYNVTSNYVDRAGGAGIRFSRRGQTPPGMSTLTGNVIWRSGNPDWGCKDDDPYESCHIRLEGAHGFAVTSNSMNAAKDYRGSMNSATEFEGRGEYSPDYGMVLQGLTNTVVRDNVLHQAALKECVVDLGGHGEGVIIKDNPGSIFVPGVTPETLMY